MKPTILIVDDEKPLRDSLAKWFNPDYTCLTAADGNEALGIVKNHQEIALIITDERMPSMSGSEFLRKAKELRPELAIIMLTAYGSVDLAVEAMRNGGADDFYQKPLTDLKAFGICVARAVEKAQLKREVRELKQEVATLKEESRAELENFTGKSPAMEKIYALIRKVAPAQANVLIEGPSGTGKELVARALHKLSKRSKGPFIAVECAALSAELLETELFGYEPGTFTNQLRDGKIGKFEAANGGTLFLDEIGEINEAMQVKLLRALESRVINRVGGTKEIPVDFRLVAATNKNLAAMVREGKFREDLFYRLNVIDLHMPALKERPGDIALLAARFLKEFATQYGSEVTGIEPDAMKVLEDYSWPGNVRQLRNVMEKMVVLSSGSKLTKADLPLEVTAAPISVPAQVSVGESLAETEKQQILAAIEAEGGNRSRAADRLGISRRTLQRRLKDWNMQ